MTNHELLKLAAKAAGYEYTGETWLDNLLCLGAGDKGARGVKVNVFDQGDTIAYRTTFLFNPLEDDGDAFRLAIKLGILFSPRLNHQIALTRLLNAASDKYSIMRRAIVPAAAEIGRCLK